MSSSRSVETGTAIFSLAEKNISLEEILGQDTQKIFSWKHLRKIRNPIENRKKKFGNSRLRIPPQICQLFLSPILLLYQHHSFFIKSNLWLVIGLQTCIKAQHSEAYAQKVKLTNLKQMAQTVAYIQEHGYGSLDDFHATLNQASDQYFQKIFKRYWTAT